MTSVDRIQGLSGSLAVKAPVRAATTAAITLSGEQTIDGVAVVEGDRVLVKSQTSSVDNGIYNVSTGGWTRALDFNGANDVVDGTLIVITDGTSNANLFSTSGTNPILPGTSAISFLADRSFGQDGLPTVEVFNGGGSTFVLSQAAEVLANVELYISGICQRPTTDFTYDNGTLTVTTTSATPSGTGNVLIRYNRLRTLGAIESDSGTFVDLTATGLFTSRGLDDNATAKALTLSGSGANSVTIANSATNPTIGTSAGGLSITTAGGTALNIDSAGSVFTIGRSGATVNIFATSGAGNLNIRNTNALTNINLDFSTTGILSFRSHDGATATEQVRINHTASADRYITLTGSNGGNPTIGTSAGGVTFNPAGQGEVLRVTTGGASTVNYWSLSGATTGSRLTLLANGSDANVGASWQTKGSGSHLFVTETGASAQVEIRHTASADRYITLTGAIAGGNPTIGTSAGALTLSPTVVNFGTATGTDYAQLFTQTGQIAIQPIGTSANIATGLYSKGTASIFLATGSTPATQVAINNTASAVRYLTLTGAIAGGNPTIGTSAGSLNLSAAVICASTLSVGTDVFAAGYAQINSNDATPAGGLSTVGYRMGSAAVGVFFGSGAPTVSAPQGSIYLRTDGGASTRLYSNNNGTTGWSAITSA